MSTSSQLLPTLPPLPEVTDILASAQSAIKDLQSLLTNFNSGGVTETTLEALALALGSDASTYPGVQQPGAYELLARVEAACYIVSAYGSDLDNKASDVNVYRKAQTYGSVPIGGATLSIPSASSSPTVFAVGTVCIAEAADPTVLPVIFLTTGIETIPTGQTSTVNANPITAQAAGSTGNQPVGSINTVVGGPYNATITNTVPSAGGADTEGDDTPNGGLRARALAAIPNAQQCTVSAVQDDALNYAGVFTSVLIENLADDGVTLQPGRGQLLVDDGTGTLGTNTALILQIQTDFDSGLYRAASTQVNVVGATLLPVTQIYIELEYDVVYASTVYTPVQIAYEVRQLIFAYVNSLGIGAPVLIAEIIRIAMEVGGVLNVPVSTVEINGNSTDLTPSFSQVARVSAANLILTPVTPLGG